ncbi:sugar phosphate nucleotidyltransferase [Candidatus Pelagibacter sp.]|uniref:sugar phosphate nucleotidyltransferase n=1 Tax=Candidatus Pelagibacter sp. TaxID=2024849 RepID=UPI003F87AE2A
MTIAYILAGGRGTRLRSVISDVPKPMAPVSGQPFLKLLLNFWIKQGITKFIISVGYLKEKVISFFGDEYNGISIEYLEEKTPLGTGGGLIILSKRLKEDFVVVNGDTFFDVSLPQLKELKRKKKAGIAMALFENNEPDRYGQVIIDEISWIRDIKQSKKNLSNLSNGGVYLMDPAVISVNSNNFNQKCSLEEDILPYLIEKKNIVTGLKQNGKFLDIGIPADYLRANNFF